MADGRYIALADANAYVGAETTSSVDVVAAAIAAAENAVDRHCGRRFTVTAASATTRTYAPTPCVVVTHDFATTTDLVVSDDGTTVDGSAFQLEPSAVSWDGSSSPWWRIRRTSGAWAVDGERRTVSVTARWGWPAIPAEVVQAALIVTKDLVHARDLRFGVASFGDYGVIRARENPIVADLLAHLRHDSTIGVA